MAKRAAACSGSGAPSLAKRSACSEAKLSMLRGSFPALAHLISSEATPISGLPSRSALAWLRHADGQWHVV
jgi:hypothetical protein